MTLTARQRRDSRRESIHTRILGPFVNTPAGRGIVEVAGSPDFFVRFEDGRREWIAAAECESVETPADYTPPSLCDLPGAAV